MAALLTVIHRDLEIPIGGTRTIAQRISVGQYGSVDHRLASGCLTVPPGPIHVARATLVECAQESVSEEVVGACVDAHFRTLDYDALLGLGEHFPALALEAPAAALCDQWTDPETGIAYAPYAERAYRGSRERALRLHHLGFSWWAGTRFLVEPL